jgi:hypothetical protein
LYGLAEGVKSKEYNRIQTFMRKNNRTQPKLDRLEACLGTAILRQVVCETLASVDENGATDGDE